MSKIVISYRRADSESIAGRIRDRLVAQYSPASVFMDIDSIPYGVDFRKYVAEALANTNVLLVIIGPAWVGELKGQKPRIHSPTDPIRIELEKAFELKLTILPILVNGAVMPEPDQLPESLSELPFLNAAAVDAGRDFHPHVDRVIRAIDGILETTGVESSASDLPSAQETRPVLQPKSKDPSAPDTKGRVFGLSRRPLVLLAAGLPAAVFLLGVGYFVYGRTSSPSAAPSVTPIDCSEERNLRSLATAVPTSVVFRNKGLNVVRIYWLDHNGKRVMYGTLGQEQVLSFRTYVTHPWVITDGSDTCKAIYMPAAHKLEIDLSI